VWGQVVRILAAREGGRSGVGPGDSGEGRTCMTPKSLGFLLLTVGEESLHCSSGILEVELVVVVV